MLSELKRLEMSPLLLVSVSDLKNFLRLEHDEDDGFIESLIISAYHFIENYCNRSILTTQWQLTWLNHNQGTFKINLFYPPIIEIKSAFELISNTYKKRISYCIEGSAICPQLVVTSNAKKILIEYEAGYGPHPRFIPQGYINAIKFLVHHWYHEKDNDKCNEIPKSVTNLLQPYKNYQLI